MVSQLKKLIRLKSKNGTILYPELGDKTVTREKLVDGNNIPVILTLKPVEDNFYKVNKNDIEEDAIYYYVEGIPDGQVTEFTPCFLNVFNLINGGKLLIPITKIYGAEDDPFATILMHSYTLSFYGIVNINGKELMYSKESDTYFDRNFLAKGSINGLDYTRISFKSSGITTVTVPPNRRMYYYDPKAKSEGRPEYSMGVRGNVTFNLDLPEDYHDHYGTVSYHIELWEYMSDIRIKFPENINFQITPIGSPDKVRGGA